MKVNTYYNSETRLLAETEMKNHVSLMTHSHTVAGIYDS